MRGAVVAIVFGACLLAGCGASPPEPAGIALSGAVFTDFHVDAPCDRQPAPRELTGVGLVFKDPAGTILGEARSGAIQVQELPKGRGTETWAHGGCRFLALYATTLPLAESYSVEFVVPDPPAGASGYFDGVNQLVPETVSYQTLADRGFTWSFEAPPAFVAS